MIKKLILAVLLVVFTPMISFSAAPTLSVYLDHADTVTVDSAADRGFEELYSLAYTMTDTAGIVVSFSGTVTLYPGTDFWCGYGTDSANRVSAANLKANNNIDSTKVISWPLWANEKLTTTFNYRMFVDSMRTQTDETDTVYLNAGIGGARGGTILITNPHIEAKVVDM